MVQVNLFPKQKCRHRLRKQTMDTKGRGERRWVGRLESRFIHCCCCLVTKSHSALLQAHQALPSMGFSRHKYWSRLPFPSPGDLPNPGIKPLSPALALAGGFFTCVYVCVYTHVHTYTYIHIHTYTYIHIHIYTHTHIYTYTHIHIHTHTHTLVCVK